MRRLLIFLIKVVVQEVGDRMNGLDKALAYSGINFLDIKCDAEDAA
jgi:hypothetical protein